MPAPRQLRRAVLGAAVGAAVLLGTTAGTATGAAAGTRQPVAVNDPGVARQWALARIGAPQAWRVATGAGTTIAIVDSGVDLAHPDLRGQLAGSADCVGHDEATGGCVEGGGQDAVGHGTHVAGIAAARTDNGTGVAGVAPGARLLAVRVLGARCTGPEPSDCEAEGTETDVAEGIRWAADHGADVVNLSLGSVTQAVVGPGRAFTDALDYAWARGAVPVLVAGNDLVLPGSLVDVPAVIVAATDVDDGAAAYSNGVGNVRWGVSAPGGESDTAESCESPTPHGILSTYHRPARAGEPATSGYACVAGTSMAAPHVSGALALLRSAGFSPAAAVDRLLETAVDLGPRGRDTTYGAGRIDVAAALAGVAPTGQAVGAASEGGSTDTGVAPPPTVPPSSTVVPAGSPPPTSPPTTTAGTASPAPSPVTEPDDVAAPPPTSPVRGSPGDDEVPALPAATAAIAVAALAAGHLWRLRASR